jgi:hypothetical protein
MVGYHMIVKIKRSLHGRFEAHKTRGNEMQRKARRSD